MPVVVFLHGMGGSKEQSAARLQELARKGLFVLAIDAHLHGAKDAIDIESIKSFVRDLRPDYEAFPERLHLLEEPKTGHSITDRMWDEGSRWFVRHLLEKPIRLPPTR